MPRFCLLHLNSSQVGKHVIELILVLTLCCFPIFYHIDNQAIRIWDESRNSLSALEMLQNKNYVVRYFDGNPESWDAKPPLLIWLQVLSIKLLGVNELAIRIPSALAALLTVLFLIGYFHHYHNNRFIGYIASFVLVTSKGYIGWHITRTGDHDSLLILFSTMIILLYYEFLRSKESGIRKLGLITFLLLLSAYTKGVAALMILPGLLIMTFLYGGQQKIFRNKWFYVCLTLFIIFYGSYYALRETLQPGYLKLVWNEELLPRYLNTNDNLYKGSVFYYLRNMIEYRNTYWLFFLIPAILIVTWPFRTEKRNLPFFLLVNATIYLLIISLGTKNIWYDGLLYPLMAVIIAYFLVQLPCYLRTVLRKNNFITRATGILLLVGIFIYPGISIMNEVRRTHEYPWDIELYSICYVLRELDNYPELINIPFSIAFTNYYAHLLFYTEKLNIAHGKIIKVKHPGLLQTGEYTLISERITYEYIKTNYRFETVFEKDFVKLLKIK